MDFKYFLEESTDFFKDANEFFNLRRKFSEKMTWLMILLGPVITIVTFLVYGTYDMFAILTFGKFAVSIRDWLRYRELSRKITKWKTIVLNAGGPFISTNDAEYHIFVYAEGMQRIHNSLFKSKVSINDAI